MKKLYSPTPHFPPFTRLQQQRPMQRSFSRTSHQSLNFSSKTPQNYYQPLGPYIPYNPYVPYGPKSIMHLKLCLTRIYPFFQRIRYSSTAHTARSALRAPTGYVHSQLSRVALRCSCPYARKIIATSTLLAEPPSRKSAPQIRSPSVLSHNKRSATSTHGSKLPSCLYHSFCSARSYSSSLYPIPHIVLIMSPLSPSLLLSFLTWVSIVRASPK